MRHPVVGVCVLLEVDDFAPVGFLDIERIRFEEAEGSRDSGRNNLPSSLIQLLRDHLDSTAYAEAYGIVGSLKETLPTRISLDEARHTTTNEDHARGPSGQKFNGNLPLVMSVW